MLGRHGQTGGEVLMRVCDGAHAAALLVARYEGENEKRLGRGGAML